MRSLRESVTVVFKTSWMTDHLWNVADRDSIAFWIAVFLTARFGLADAVDEVRKPGTSAAQVASEVNPAAESSTPPALQVVLKNLGIFLVRIDAGSFQMGSSNPSRFGQFSQCEGPRHSVEISKTLLVARHEVTVGQFRTFVTQTSFITDAERSKKGCNGLDVAAGNVVRKPDCVWSSPGFHQTADHPVVCVSWNDAVSFCRWLTLKTGKKCRLPTEAEWEYCCRAGSDRLFTSGDNPDSLRLIANCGDLSLKAHCESLTATADWDDKYPYTAPVGSLRANAFGIYDMHGNVGEWCLDWFDAAFYSKSPNADPKGPEMATQWRVVRGGSWYNNPFGCRSSGRHDGVPTEASTTNGFRVVIELDENE